MTDVDEPKRRKRNWNAGLTREQQAIATRIQIEHVRAYDDERARGAFGAPGSIWEIVNGALRLRVPTGTEQALMTDDERARYAVTATASPSAVVTGASGDVMTDDDALRAPYRCEAITISGVRCRSNGVTRQGRKGPLVCGTHRYATRLISEEQRRQGIERRVAYRTPQERAVLAAIDRSPVPGMLRMQQIVDAMTDSERALFSTWGDLHHVIAMLQWRRGLRTRHCERDGGTVLFVLRPPGVVAKLKAAKRAEWGEYPAGEVLAVVEKLERVQPWDPTSSSAPSFMMTLRRLAAEHERVALSPRQVGWLELLLSRAKQMVEPEPPVEPVEKQPDPTASNVVELRPQRRVL